MLELKSRSFEVVLKLSQSRVPCFEVVSKWSSVFSRSCRFSVHGRDSDLWVLEMVFQPQLNYTI